MAGYYSDKLSADRLRLCYELAPPEVQGYLDAEVRSIRAAIRPGDRVLELGCGYGRVLAGLASTRSFLVGVDLSLASLGLARRLIPGPPRPLLGQMNAIGLAFRDAAFDLVCCPQNGISAFHVDPEALIRSAVRVTAPGGKVLFFSYAEEFWPHRLAWFRIQAAHGLIGPIDEGATGDGVIVCRDGFTATTVSPRRFAELTHGLGTSVSISTLEHASVVCEILV